MVLNVFTFQIKKCPLEGKVWLAAVVVNWRIKVVVFEYVRLSTMGMAFKIYGDFIRRFICMRLFVRFARAVLLVVVLILTFHLSTDFQDLELNEEKNVQNVFVSGYNRYGMKYVAVVVIWSFMGRFCRKQLELFIKIWFFFYRMRVI